MDVGLVRWWDLHWGGGGPALLRWNMLAGLWASPQVSESALYPLLSQAPFCHFRAAVMFSEAFWVVRKSIGPGLWWGQFSAQRAGGGGGEEEKGGGGGWRGTMGFQHQSMGQRTGPGGQMDTTCSAHPALPLSFPVHSSHARGDVQPDPRVLSRVSGFA